MDFFSGMSMQVTQLQQTLSLNMLKSANSMQAAEATVMLQNFAETQASIQNAVQAPHPTSGNLIDIKA
ncbi:polyribonucleotide nucleotidyltransferase [Brevibacillus fulvus]|uniref:Motility protein n=1 Tax=Brevibacillus fulvus TaxID=1125967 RepID=A0A938Y339_9BACL|nr:polyribonucleotide nucleotidyltransferase [Brevibacillus fulvus]MBM7591479.1 hypothetical protein [Brevibacillus fulvus]